MQPWKNLPDHAKQQNSRMGHKQEHNIHAHVQINTSKHHITAILTVCYSWVRSFQEQNQTFFEHTVHTFFLLYVLLLTASEENNPPPISQPCWIPCPSLLASLRTLFWAWEDTLSLMLRHAIRNSPNTGEHIWKNTLKYGRCSQLTMICSTASYIVPSRISRIQIQIDGTVITNGHSTQVILSEILDTSKSAASASPHCPCSKTDEIDRESPQLFSENYSSQSPRASMARRWVRSRSFGPFQPVTLFSAWGSAVPPANWDCRPPMPLKQCCAHTEHCKK